MMEDSFEICPITREIDEALFRIETQVNWLPMLSPLDNDKRWNVFLDSGFRDVMPLRYPELKTDYKKLCKELDSLPFDKMKNSLLHALLHEKKEELILQIDLIKEREKAGFLATSVSLFGGTSPSLLEVAHDILTTVPIETKVEKEAKVEDFFEEAIKVRTFYQEIEPDFDFKIHIVDDLNSSMMVHHGELYLAKSLHIPHDRVRALIAHEVEVHILTYYNGGHQPLKQLQTGLAYYDSLQEGLATLSEFLAGNLPSNRLRTLAARVFAVNLALKERSIKEIFDTLYEEYKLGPEEAFDTAVRAKRGGGLTKDACYLEGLRELLSYLVLEEDIELFFIGKFAITQRELMKKLLRKKIIRPAKLLPKFIFDGNEKVQFRNSKRIPLVKLYH